jgi:gluconate 2-dehydrogenase alpha chain
MVTKLKEVDVVVGLGWTGGILAKELAEAGLKVVAIERGEARTTDKDYAVPGIRDELRYVVRHELMMNTARDTLTIRNNPSQDALPMRRLGSFLPGDGVGGSGVHWSGHTWRWTDMEFKVRSMYEEHYGKNFIPADMTIQDRGITYDELEPYYDRFEYTAAVSARSPIGRSTPSSVMSRIPAPWCRHDGEDGNNGKGGHDASCIDGRRRGHAHCRCSPGRRRLGPRREAF